MDEPIETPSLRDMEWDVGYSHEDGDLIRLFFVPALSRAQLYLRATGYFSGDVLALAARGLDGLIARGGRMHLLVGCTLGEQDTVDFNEPFAYLVIYQTSEDDLRFTLSNNAQSTPFVVHNNKTIFLLTVDIFPHEKSASKRGVLQPVEIRKTIWLGS